MGYVWWFFLIKDPLVRKTPSQVGLFQIEIFPFGKTGVNCHSKAFERLETPTLLDSQLGEYEGSAIRCRASLKSETALIIFPTLQRERGEVDLLEGFCLESITSSSSVEPRVELLSHSRAVCAILVTLFTVTAT